MMGPRIGSLTTTWYDWELPVTECSTPAFDRLPAMAAEELWSRVVEVGPALSEHPNSTNAILAISNRARERVFTGLPFLMICGMDEDGTSQPPLTKQVRFSSGDWTAGSSGEAENGALGGSVVPRWEPHLHAQRWNVRLGGAICQGKRVDYTEEIHKPTDTSSHLPTRRLPGSIWLRSVEWKGNPVHRFVHLFGLQVVVHLGHRGVGIPRAICGLISHRIAVDTNKKPGHPCPSL